MSSPIESPEFKTLYLGDTHDDDGTVIDAFLIETDTPAKPVTEAISPTPLIEPKRTTRLMSGTFVFDNTQIASYSPIQILPADANRQDLTIKGFSFASPVTVTDYIYIADENGKTTTLSAGRLRPSSSDFDLSEHTGAVWIYPNSGITGSFEVSWWATTL